MTIRILGGDCLARLRELPDDSVDSCAVDPPYHLTEIVKRFGGENAAPAKRKGTGVYARQARGFMGQKWDGGDIAFQPDVWREVYRVLKPGAWLAAFAAPRNSHRMVAAIEAAGFEVRDSIANLILSDYYVHTFLASLDAEQAEAFARCIHDSPFGGVLEWVFGQGFPKSDDAERSIAKLTCPLPGRHYARKVPDDDVKPGDHVCPVTPESAPWQGFGTALKPAHEPISLARKPFAASSLAANVLQYGTGAINIDAGRVATDDEIKATRNVALGSSGSGIYGKAEEPGVYEQNDQGRHPANVILAEGGEVASAFPQSKAGKARPDKGRGGIWTKGNGVPCGPQYGDEGSAARFFYTAKPDAAERHEGCRDLPNRKNPHPTVKPIGLMCYVVGQITPPGGTVLDPFLGSGTTAIAAAKLQMHCIGIELNPEYVALAQRRIHHHVGLFADLTIDHAPPASEAEDEAGDPNGGENGERNDARPV